MSLLQRHEHIKQPQRIGSAHEEEITAVTQGLRKVLEIW